MSDNNGSFIRWQKITIEQLTYSINLILGLSVAILGFQIDILFNDYPIFQKIQKCLYGTSAVVITMSVLFGLWCVCNRLLDFRETMHIARDKEQGMLLAKTRALIKKHGRKTWCLFWLQIIAFGIGILLMIVSITPLISGIF